MMDRYVRSTGEETRYKVQVNDESISRSMSLEQKDLSMLEHWASLLTRGLPFADSNAG